LMRFTHDKTPASSKALMASVTVERARRASAAIAS
jgi:hypothetical protein